MTFKTHASSTPPEPISLLILGAGWTSTFLLPLLTTKHITHAATTRSGSSTTIPFTFTPDSSDKEPYTHLPPASTILITFPLKGRAAALHLLDLYNATHPLPPSSKRHWLLFGSTGIWKGGGWHSETSAYDTGDPRAEAEDALLSLSSSSTSSPSPPTPTTTNSSTILNLSGLYGGTRKPRDWLARVATTKNQLRDKGCVHLVHGSDVARAVVLCMEKWDAVAGRRWVLTDLRCYDWWALGMEWGRYAREKKAVGKGGGREEGAGKGEEEGGGEGEECRYEQWVRELMEEEGVRALPRDSGMLGRKMDGRGFWGAVGDVPEVGRVE